MEKKLREKMFERFLELYKDNKIKIFFFKDSFSIGVKDNSFKDDEENKNFKKFTTNFIRALKGKFVDNEEDDNYNVFIKKFEDYDKDIKSEVITKSTSNLNIIYTLDYEILTKRDKDLNTGCFSTMVNINYKKPTNTDSLLEQISFELSVKDLKKLRDKIDNTIDDISKLMEQRGV